MSRRPPRIAITGAGIAGSLIGAGLRERGDVELICLEKVEAAGHSEAGTGLNIGPNAIKSLIPGDSVADISEETWDTIMDVNAKGVWLGMRAALPTMIANKRGKICNVARPRLISGPRMRPPIALRRAPCWL